MQTTQLARGKAQGPEEEAKTSMDIVGTVPVTTASASSEFFGLQWTEFN